MTAFSIKELTKRNAEDSLLNTLITTGPSLPAEGAIVEGIVIDTDQAAIYVDIGHTLTGVILGREIKRYPRVFRHIDIGDTITAKVVDVENDEGFTELSVKEAEEQRRWDTLRKLKEQDDPFETTILDANKGGLIVELENVQGFMPVSQLSQEHYPRVEGGDKQKIYQALQELVGETLRMKIIDLDPDEEKLIVSERAAEQKKIKEELENYGVGDVVEGTVTGVVDFGAFMKFENLEGLIHISEIDWRLIDDPHDVLNVSDTLKAEIIEIDGDRISLSLKTLKDNPWDRVENRYAVGTAVEGEVTKLNPFGAFVQLDDKIQGLAHVSEFGSEESMREALTVGETYPFTVLNIEAGEYRMALGFRQGNKKPSAKQDPEQSSNIDLGTIDTDDEKPDEPKEEQKQEESEEKAK